MFTRIKNKSYLLLLIIISIFSIGGSFSYALFTTSIEKTKALNISVGRLYSDIYSPSLVNNSITVNSYEEKIITITLTNINKIKAKFNLYYDLVEENNDLNVSYLDSTNTISSNGIVIDSNKSLNYDVKIVNNSNKSTTVLFESDVGLSDKELLFPNDKHQIK